MGSNQLRSVMKRDRLGRVFFRGVYAADQAKALEVTEFPSGYIITTDPSDKPGTHWVCLYVWGTPSNSKGDFFSVLTVNLLGHTTLNHGSKVP